MEVIVGVFLLVVIVIGYMIAKTRGGRRLTTSHTVQQTTAQKHINSDKSYPFSEVIEDANFPHVRSIHTKIRGVTKENPDGVNRQQIIRKCCRRGDALFLIREKDNPVDPNAIQVRRIVYCNTQDKYQLGEQIGYVSRELVQDLAPKMDHDGFVLMAWIMNVTGRQDSEALGVNIQIEEYRPAKHQAPSRRKTTKKAT